MKFLLIGLALFTAPYFACAGDKIPLDKIPDEVKAFVEKNTEPISVTEADLNGDGLQDFVLILEKQNGVNDEAKGARTLLILLRQPDGQLKEAKRNDKVVYCATCGGMMGDPFQGIAAGTKTFSISQCGGSAWRWTADYKFNYSRKDDTWQLVRIEESSYKASAPHKVKRKIYTSPKYFGKIDIAEFDPDKWKGQGSN
jgi:hypothetical protein